MLRQEEAIGDYTSNPSVNVRITGQARQQMVLLIEELHALKQYKVETLYLAVSLADRYLVYIAVGEAQAPPSLVTLAVTCILMAAKLEEPIAPSFARMINLLAEQQQTVLDKTELIDLEEAIVKMLDFSLRHVSSIHFLERFTRLFGIDQERNDKRARQVANLARDYCKCMQREALFLDFRPSQNAAASLLLAINVSQSGVAPALGIKRIPPLEMKSLLNEALSVHDELAAGFTAESNAAGPITKWNSAIEKLTFLKRDSNVGPAYSALIEYLNESLYKEKLFDDPTLFI